MKHFVLAAVLAVAPLTTVAATYSAGTITSTPTVDINTVSIGPFEDVINFSISTAGDLSFSLTGADLGAILDLAGPLRARVFTGFDGLAGNAITPIEIGDPLDAIVLGLTAGDYSIKLRGVGDGTAGGAYAYELHLAAIPEAETWAMLLAGLGLVGMKLRRRAAVL